MNKKFKRVLAVMLVLGMVCLPLFGCSAPVTTASQAPAAEVPESAAPAQEPASNKDGIKIGISFGTLENDRFQREAKIMQDYVAGMEGVEVIVQSAQSDAALQNSQVENLISQGVDVLLILPQDGGAMSSVVATANEENIPVVAYDRMIMDCNINYYISFDSVLVGELMTKYVVETLGVNKGNFICCNGSTADNNAYLVQKGVLNVLQPYIDKGDIKIVSDEFCDNWDGNIAMTNVENALTKVNNDVQAVITSYDGLANGAIQALEAQGLAGKVPVTGQDGELAACQAIVEGKMSCTVYKPLNELARIAIDSCIKIARGEKVEVGGKTSNNFKEVDSIIPSIYCVDKNNMKEIIIDGGFQTLDNVYANVPKDQWPK